MTETLSSLPPFLLYALGGGVLLALLTGPLGCFLVWRRMSFFGDALAHAALLGVALALFAELPISMAVMLVGALFALLLLLLQKGDLANDTLLAILSPTALSLGMIALHMLPDVRVDLSSYLFGDILALRPANLLWLGGSVALALALLALNWRKLLALTAARDLAVVDGYPALRLELLLLLLTALVVAAGVQMVGVLLITALLVIPAATASRFAHTPLHMAVLASGTGLAAVLAGLTASYVCDLPPSPSIVVSAALLFSLSRAVKT